MNDTEIKHSLQNAKRLLCQVADEIHARAHLGERPAIVAHLSNARDAINGALVCRIPQDTGHELTREACQRAVDHARQAHRDNPEDPTEYVVYQTTLRLARERFRDIQ